MHSLFWQIVFSCKINVHSVNGNSEGIVINYVALRFKLKCYCTVTKVCKLRVIGSLGISTA